MIDAIFCSEFDLQKGCVIKAHYPLNYEYDEITLAAYMLPDGVQKFDSDISVFKYKLKQSVDEKLNQFISKINQNELNELVDLYRFNTAKDNWDEQIINCTLSISTTGDQIIFTSPEIEFGHDTQQIKFNTHKDIQYQKLKDDFYSFYTENEGDSYGINFKNPQSIQKLNLQKLMQNLKEQYQLDSQSRISIMSQQSHELTQSNESLNIIKDNNINNLDDKNKVVKVEKQFTFYSLIKNKRDQQFKRGLLTRGIGIASENNEILYYFEKAIKYYLDIFIEFPIEQDIKPILKLLEDAYNQINSLNLPQKYLQIPKDTLIYSEDLLNTGYNQSSVENITLSLNELCVYQIQPNQSIFQDYTNSSLIDLIKKFKESTMKIWSAILKEQRILFVGYDKSIRECVKIASSLQLLALPLNISKKIQLYSHLQDLQFVEQPSYVATVSNPLIFNKQNKLFESRESWWDMCCNIQDGTVKENEKLSTLEQIVENKVIGLDKEFYNEIDKRIKDNSIDEYGVRQMFYNYTKYTIDFMMNTSNLIDQGKEDKLLQQSFSKRAQRFAKTKFYQNIILDEENQRIKFKQFFGETNYIQIFESLLILKDTRILNDLELITLYSTIYTHSKLQSQLMLILRYIFHKKNSLDCLGIGLFSKSEQVVKKNLQMLVHLENSFPIGKIVLKSFSFLMLYTFENMKTRYQFTNFK